MAGASKGGESIQISIDDSQIKAGRDVSITGSRQETHIENVGAGASVVVGDENVVSSSGSDAPDLATQLADWQAHAEAEIDALTGMLKADKEDLRETIAKIKAEAIKAEEADPGRLERLLNTLAAMGPDIFEVALTTLISPLAGIGLALKKISDKAKIERQAQET